MSGNAPACAEELWHRLESYEIGPPDAALSFAQRLARENGWSADHAALVLREYKRFCHLAMTAGHTVTPSDAVDQAWHLHLAYTRDYWQRFCPEVLGRELHHGPTAGGRAEFAKHHEQYAQTLRSYQSTFGEAPPAAVWPDAHTRFHIDSRAYRINPSHDIVVPRKLAGRVAATGAILAIAALLVWLGS